MYDHTFGTVQMMETCLNGGDGVINNLLVQLGVASLLEVSGPEAVSQLCSL